MIGPKVAIVGEAWGEEEESLGHPFVGPSGRELIKMLSEADWFPDPGLWRPLEIREWWLTQTQFFVTNVFQFRPKGNEIDTLCAPKKDVSNRLPMLRAGKYLRDEYLPELDRLAGELSELSPNLCIALGNTACWALLHNSGISKIRGACAESRFPAGCKVLPTYHPAAILRQWDLRAVTVLDLAKGKRESGFRDIRRPERTIYLDPNLQDLEEFHHEHLARAKRISFDIETAGDQITCIGFAPDARVALVIPFVDPRRPGGSYWGTAEEERGAWNFVRRVLRSPTPKLAQNGLYDIHFLWRRYGITVNNFEDDTMLLHHALQPESPKGLAFLGSVYTNESSWKLMNRKGTELKKDN